MKVSGAFTISFSGITVRFIPQAPVTLGNEFLHLMCDDDAIPDVEYEIRPLTAPLRPSVAPVYDNHGTMIYRIEEGWLRIYPMLQSKDGCQVACLLRFDGKNVMYYPESLWDHYTCPIKCVTLIAMESVLLRHNAMLLHSSVVHINGKAILFSGPSCVGKSTQAALWEQYAGAQILNGDRCVIRNIDGTFYGGGSPLAGSSGIYHKEYYPIAGIFLLEQAPENNVTRVLSAAFSPLLSQTLVNSWDTEFMNEISRLYQQLLMQVPVYKLRCRPDEGAVRVAYQTIFGKEP